MKKLMKLTGLIFLLVMTFSMTAFAAGWTTGQGENSSRWWYDLGNGNYYAGTEGTPFWQWLDGNQDGIAECYAFDAEGWMYANGTTPDGYEVNADGAWTVNGAVQTRTVETAANAETENSDTLVVYFSWSGNTEEMATYLAERTNGDLLELEPSNPYPEDYTATGNLARTERDTNARPAIANLPASVEQYDTILVGYPIWWHTAPMIIGTFLESYDLTGVDIYPFSQSGSMDTEQFDASVEFVRTSAPGANIHDGLFAEETDMEAMDAYLAENGLTQ